MSKAAYSPLAPVYQQVKNLSDDAEIALDDLAERQQSPRPVDASPCCEKTACKKRPLGVRIVRCFCAVALVGMLLWLITGTAFLTYMGVKAHRCLHPRHMASRTIQLSSDVRALELGVVAGDVRIRSCPYARNVSLTVRTFAASEALLSTMVLDDKWDTASATRRLVLSAPSFDWMHCQRASMELVVPESLAVPLDVKAQLLLGRLEASHVHGAALRHLSLSGSLAHVNVHDVELAGTATLAADVAAARVDELRADRLVLALGVAAVKVQRAELASAMDAQLRIGHARLGHVKAPQSATLSAELAWASLYDMESPQLTARVDYGAVNVIAHEDFAGRFEAVSPYGFLAVDAADQVEGVTYAKQTLAEISGSRDRLVIAATEAAVDTPKETVKASETVSASTSMSLRSIYGSVSLFFPNPATQWEREHRRAH